MYICYIIHCKYLILSIFCTVLSCSNYDVVFVLFLSVIYVLCYVMHLGGGGGENLYCYYTISVSIRGCMIFFFQSKIEWNKDLLLIKYIIFRTNTYFLTWGFWGSFEHLFLVSWSSVYRDSCETSHMTGKSGDFSKVKEKEK